MHPQPTRSDCWGSCTYTPTLNLSQYAIKTSLHIQAVFVSALNALPYTFCKLHTYKLLICNSCRLTATVKIIRFFLTWLFLMCFSLIWAPDDPAMPVNGNQNSKRYKEIFLIHHSPPTPTINSTIINYSSNWKFIGADMIIFLPCVFLLKLVLNSC